MPLGENDSRYVKAITERAEIADPANSQVLETGNFCNNEPSLGCTNMNKSFDLEAITPKPTA